MFPRWRGLKAKEADLYFPHMEAPDTHAFNE
jgi:hypothetical protein